MLLLRASAAPPNYPPVLRLQLEGKREGQCKLYISDQSVALGAQIRKQFCQRVWRTHQRWVALGAGTLKTPKHTISETFTIRALIVKFTAVTQTIRGNHVLTLTQPGGSGPTVGS